MRTATVAVIGGGVSGLALAHRLQELSLSENFPLRISLLEAAPRFGGIVATEKKDGFLLEKGPDAFLREKPWALALAARLGIANELISTRERSRKSYIVRRGRLHAVPKGFYLIAPLEPLPFLVSPLFTPWGKLRMLSEPWIQPGVAEGDESIADFVRRRFGQECLERAGQPMLGGIYTGDPDELSLLATMGRFRHLEREHGSLIRGLKRERAAKEASGPRYGLFASFQGGMQTLTDALIRKLASQDLRTDCAVRQMVYDLPTKKWHLGMAGGVSADFDAVCLALPPKSAKELFKSVHSDISRDFSLIHHESAATAYFAYKDAQFSRLPEGAGFVVPSTEKSAAIACTFADQKFPGRAPAGYRLLRAFAGGAYGRDHLKADDGSLLAAITQDLERWLGIRGVPVFASLQRHPGAMIQYGVGHLEIAERLHRRAAAMPGLFLAGAGFSGVGIPDCIHEAESGAEKAFAYIKEKT